MAVAVEEGLGVVGGDEGGMDCVGVGVRGGVGVVGGDDGGAADVALTVLLG